ncbi:oxidoreductase-like protein [Dichotomocladium elegans]|nr:oxidoreductase-like protein [Dichotomocladium elegans]
MRPPLYPLRTIRHFHVTKTNALTSYKRIPNYDGWWTLILKQPHCQDAIDTSSQENQRKPLPIPTVEATLPPPPLPPSSQREVVYLNGKEIELPQKPPAPDNCCMSGCAVCVWDLYKEDMEVYQAKKDAIRAMFKRANVELPPSLAPSNKTVIEEMEQEMDPTMKAFLAMERKLKG